MTDIQLLNEVVVAWESLEGDKYYTPGKIDNWLSEDMKPVMDKIRKHLTQVPNNG